MTDQFREIFCRIENRPAMWLIDNTLASHMTFAMGVHEGTDGNLFQGLTEFLLAKIGTMSNLAWPGLVMWLVEPVGYKEGGHRQLPDDLNQAAIARWYQLLDEFLSRRAEPGGTTRIYAEYLGMLKRTGLSFGHPGTENLGLALAAIREDHQPDV